MHEANLSLREARQFFENNIHDAFGESILSEYFTPCESDIKALEEAVVSAERESTAIQDMIKSARAMI